MSSNSATSATLCARRYRTYPRAPQSATDGAIRCPTVLAATGRNQSGEMTLFEQGFANDRTRLRGLLGSQPRRETNYDKHTPDKLEKLLISVHAFQVQIADVRGKYQRLFQDDDDRRREIRAEHQR
jgi:hypothetical protein